MTRMPAYRSDRAGTRTIAPASLLWVLVAGALLAPPAGAQLANVGRRGLRVHRLADVVRLPDDEIDLGTAALMVSEEWSGEVQGLHYRQQLDDMALDVKRRLREQGVNSDVQAVAVLNDYLFGDLGLTAVPNADDPGDLFLHTVLDRRRGYCLSLSVLYLAMTERLGLPVYGVVVPGHFFVRYDDGSRRFNIETTSRGRSLPDEYYIEAHRVPPDRLSGLYLKNLTNLQTLGCFFNNFGLVYYQTGHTDAAITALDLAVRINPMLFESRLNLGSLYVRKGLADPAIEHLRAGLAIKDDNAAAWCDLGSAYLLKDWPDQAVRYYRRALQVDPNLVAAHAKLAEVYKSQGHLAVAEQHLRQALRIAPDSALLYGQLGDLLAGQGRLQEAIEQLNQGLRLNYRIVELWLRLGQCYRELSDPAAELSAYQKAVTIDADHFGARANLALAYFNQKRYAEAIVQLRQALSLKPKDPLLLDCLGVSLVKLEQTDEALTAFYQAVEADPAYGLAHYHLACELYRLGQSSEAFSHLQTARRLGQEVPDELFQAMARKAGQSVN